MIEHANIIYMPTISALGGIETYVYELVKKYHNLDIAVVSKKCEEKQKERIQKYCRVYIHNGEKIKCDVAIINYDQSIIRYINEDAKIYQTIHADYTNSLYDHQPKPNPRITAFLGITQYLTKNMADMLKPNKIELCYNPLTIEDKKPLIFVSATRLHENKGVDLLRKFIKELDKHNIYYLWFILTNDLEAIKEPNVITIPPRLDVDKFLSLANYVCLTSKTEADSYTLKEGLFRNIPIITTPLPYLEEIGYKDGVNGYTIEFDGSNIEDIVKKIQNVPSFNYEKIEDNYMNIFKESKSKYEEELKMKVKVRCIQNYYDMECSERKVINESVPYEEPDKHPNRVEWITTRERADHLVNKGLVKIVEVLKEDKKIEKAIPKTKVEKSKKKTK